MLEWILHHVGPLKDLKLCATQEYVPHMVPPTVFFFALRNNVLLCFRGIHSANHLQLFFFFFFLSCAALSNFFTNFRLPFLVTSCCLSRHVGCSQQQCEKAVKKGKKPWFLSWINIYILNIQLLIITTTTNLWDIFWAYPLGYLACQTAPMSPCCIHKKCQTACIVCLFPCFDDQTPHRDWNDKLRLFWRVLCVVAGCETGTHSLHVISWPTRTPPDSKPERFSSVSRTTCPQNWTNLKFVLAFAPWVEPLTFFSRDMKTHIIYQSHQSDRLQQSQTLTPSNKCKLCAMWPESRENRNKQITNQE